LLYYDADDNSEFKGTKRQTNTRIYYNDGTLIQPEMRYKPRTDLERIFDTINQNSFGKVSKLIIDKQLRNLDLNYSKKRKNTEEDEEMEDDGTVNIATVHAGQTQSANGADKHEKGDILNKTKKTKAVNINSEAKNMMSELHHKTHFKGAAVIASQSCKYYSIKISA
jgi:hypothetical protein